VIRLGVVSFLNSRPLIAGLEADDRVDLRFDVPAALPALLDCGVVDVALVPVIDVLRSRGGLTVVSDACIGCDGETMTVRVFSRVPPDRIRTLHVDGDSHTSVALARVLWRALYGVTLEVQPFDARRTPPDALPAVLLIGDKVVDPRRGRFAYEVDLGGAWYQQTGLPFVFAVWARRATRAAGADPPPDHVRALLEAARDRGVAQAAAIAHEVGPRLGWPAALAERYLTRCLTFRLDARAVAGVGAFASACRAEGLVPEDATAVAWPVAAAATPVAAAAPVGDAG